MRERLLKSNELQRKAYAVIERLGLNSVWAQVGKPILVGSVRFGLLSKPNIDYEIYSPKPSISDGFSVIQRIAEIPGVMRIKYANCINSFDYGLYWRIDYIDEEGITWDIDNWLLSDDHPDAGVAENLAQAMESALTDDAREKILEIKDEVYGTLTTRGIDIYKAVLRDQVNSAGEFREWHSKNTSCNDIDRWHP